MYLCRFYKASNIFVPFTINIFNFKLKVKSVKAHLWHFPQKFRSETNRELNVASFIQQQRQQQQQQRRNPSMKMFALNNFCMNKLEAYLNVLFYFTFCVLFKWPKMFINVEKWQKNSLLRRVVVCVNRIWKGFT